MAERLSILLVGIGGYGNNYIREILTHGKENNVEIVGAVDPKPEGCDNYEHLKEMGIQIFSTIEEFYSESEADLAVLSTPINFHMPHTCLALSKGSNVLCEKPAAATVQDVYKMMEAADKTGKVLAIGYQWSFSDTMQSLKRDVMEGRFGRPIRLKTLALWPRNAAYFSRPWAAKMKSAAGEWILDSVAMNATAHHLHNMLYILGKKPGLAARPVAVIGELYRANQIETFDTAAARIIVEGGTELLFYATHAVKDLFGPVFEYEFENGTVSYDFRTEEVKAFMKDGTIVQYGNPNKYFGDKLWDTINAIRTGDAIPCTAETALPHVMCINGLHESVPEIPEFNRNLVRTDTDKAVVYVEGLYEDFFRCYENNKLPSEAGMSWAICGKEIPLWNYTHFPTYK